MKMSLVILTFNRGETVRKAMLHNFKNAGRAFDEIIWVDNGSETEQLTIMADGFLGNAPDVLVRNGQNLGVAKGYNRGVVLATGTHVVITGCDRFMPDNWAATFEKYFKQIPETGLISCYSQPISVVSERIRKEPEVLNGLHIQHAMPMEAKCFRRDLLKEVGHLREDLGLYGHEDLLWADRMERVCKEKNLIYYTIPGFIAKHEGSEGVAMWNGCDPKEYHEFKQRECTDPAKLEYIQKIKNSGNPYFNPYF